MSAKAVREFTGPSLHECSQNPFFLRLPRPSLAEDLAKIFSKGTLRPLGSARGTPILLLFSSSFSSSFHLLFRNSHRSSQCSHSRSVLVDADSSLEELPSAYPWLLEEKLVVKPDLLIKRRGKLGLLAVNKSFEEVKAWISERRNTEFSVGTAKGILSTFIIEPFISHAQNEEYYLAMISTRAGDDILFHHQGGIDVGDVDSKANRISVLVGDAPTPEQLTSLLASVTDVSRRALLWSFITDLFATYTQLHFTYLEINPLVVRSSPEKPSDLEICVLDLAARLDQTAEYECGPKWGPVDFPPPFGRGALPEELHIADMDNKTGASLKLTVLNPNGRIWTMVAGGGASVIYSDTIADLGGAADLANYGEYSGAPSTAQTYEYAKTILSLMTREFDAANPKVLLIGGGIANFTNVAATFKGIEKALKEFSKLVVAQKIRIFIRRGGPNYQEGLKSMKALGKQLGITMHVFGPETHMTAIVAMALGKAEIKSVQIADASNPFSMETSINPDEATSSSTEDQGAPHAAAPTSAAGSYQIFSKTTRSFVYGMQKAAVQRMLDFDHACGRAQPSVAAVIYPFEGNFTDKYYWGTKEVLIPVFEKFADAAAKYPDVDSLVNFQSQRSAFAATMEALEFKQIRSVSIIAEGIPERKTKLSNRRAAEKGVTIIGPATVGGIKPGCFRIGNTGGMMDNIVTAKLYRPGSVGYVARSGGMSNELNNIIARSSDGVYEGIAIGGDRYPGSTFIDHLLRYEADPACKMLVMLGEVGGIEEYVVAEAIKSGKITKPLVAWCIGTCASLFETEVQFGHAGALAHSDRETAAAKNAALKASGAHVPVSFNDIGTLIETVFGDLVKQGKVTKIAEPPIPKIPVDYQWAKELGLIRKPTNFLSTISDDRGEELLYNGVPISDVVEKDLGIGGTLGLLWFQRTLPKYLTDFLELCIVLTADHGPAVSGAHNTIVATRANKDLVSSLCSGLLTIGDRFGGALDGAAQQFSAAFDAGQTPAEFVNTMRQQNRLILGIGHRIKSVTNPDKRVELIKKFAKENFDSTPLLDFAVEVEKITTAKKPNLILNVDGAIATATVDLLRSCGQFTAEQAKEYIENGILNGLFVLGRTIGFIGHYLDQKRLKQGLYRHPWDDITYLSAQEAQW